MTQQTTWPADSEWVMCPDEHEVALERQYWAAMDATAEYAASVEMQAELDSFTSWPLGDLVEELETLRVLTPDQEDAIAEITAEITRRTAAA